MSKIFCADLFSYHLLASSILGGFRFNGEKKSWKKKINYKNYKKGEKKKWKSSGLQQI